MRNTFKTCSLLVTILMITFGVFGQSTKTVRKLNPIAIDKLNGEMLPLPAGVLTDSNFFDYKVDSTSEITINLYDAGKTKQAEVKLLENAVKKTLEYRITIPNQDSEWVRVTINNKEGKIISSALSSSGKLWK